MSGVRQHESAAALIDVVGIGNALVDVISHESDELVDELGLTKGTMRLIDQEEAESLYERMGAGTEISGGSGANTIVGVAALGGTAQYIGKVRDDQLGDVFAHDLRATGVGFDVAPTTSGASSGRCLILVTPDAQRTMNTYLGASVSFGPDDLDESTIASAKVLYLEGYLFDSPEAQAAFRTAAEIARSAGGKVAVTLSDPFCVERHRDAFLDLIDSNVDLLFANEAEACSLFRCESVSEAAAALADKSLVAAITRSEHGSLVVSGDERVEVRASAVERVVDTTGAGDLFAAGFLFGFSRSYDLERCARIGSIAAAEVISHVGARPNADLRELAAGLI